jgi:hypothetical protein
MFISICMKFVKASALVVCLGIASSACFWRERDVHDDRRGHEHEEHHDDHRGDRR